MSQHVQHLFSRKILAFIVMALSITGCAATLSYLDAPVEVIKSALWTVGLGGLFTIGGQSLIDSIAKWRHPE